MSPSVIDGVDAARRVAWAKYFAARDLIALLGGLAVRMQLAIDRGDLDLAAAFHMEIWNLTQRHIGDRASTFDPDLDAIQERLERSCRQGGVSV